MNWIERQVAKLAWGKAQKQMPQLKRWVPLIGVAVIATSTILRAWDLSGPAAALDSLAGALGITSASPVGPGELTAAAAALAGVVIKVYSVVTNPPKR